MHAFDVLGDPVRRRILELLAGGEQSSGDVVEVISAGVRDRAAGGVACSSRCCARAASPRSAPTAARRLYAIDSAPLAQVDAWLSPFRQFWEQRLDALGTELRRGRG